MKSSKKPAQRAKARLSPTVRFGLYIRERRQSLGISLPKFAVLAGIQKSTLSKIENGKGNPSLETLVLLAAGFKIELGKLLSVAYSERHES